MCAKLRNVDVKIVEFLFYQIGIQLPLFSALTKTENMYFLKTSTMML